MSAPPAFDIEVPPPRVEPTPRWVRVRAGGEWVADSRRALLLAWYGPDMLPTYCLPDEDVRTDLLTRAGHPAPGGAVTYDVRVGDAVLGGAAQRFEDPPEALSALRGHWTFAWDGHVSWFEEALEVRTHARDPASRIDVIPSERHVRVELDGVLLAESRRPSALFERGLPTRWYLPAEDVDFERLVASETTSTCPYKGVACWWSAATDGELRPDVAWAYPEPVPECPGVTGRVAFLNEKVDLTVDGEPQSRPFTPWSL